MTRPARGMGRYSKAVGEPRSGIEREADRCGRRALGTSTPEENGPAYIRSETAKGRMGGEGSQTSRSKYNGRERRIDPLV